MFTLENISKKPIVEMIIEQITNSIISGEFRPGCRIPTEQELVGSLGASRNSVREALKILIAYGILEIRRPEGTYVCEGFRHAMLNPCVYGLIIGGKSAKDILMIRKIFDIGVMFLAIEFSDEEGLGKIKYHLNSLIDSLKKKELDVDEIVRNDIAFHKSIELVVPNTLVGIVNDMITNITLYSRMQTIEKTISEGNVDRMIESHKRIYQVLVNKDIKMVNEVIDYSYEFWKENL